MLLQEGDETPGERSDLFDGTLRCQTTSVIEGFVSLGDGDLIWQNDDADVSEDGPQMHESAHAAECSGGGAEESGGFSAVGGEWRFVIRLAA